MDVPLESYRSLTILLPEQVSILVLMDVPLESVTHPMVTIQTIGVSILVLMDVPLELEPSIDVTVEDE